ncbi:DUF1800 domain-containing protein [Corallococcus aberystwythensis]|uniref:DUF1800 domain-containing protein n=1 Tax=Corallococcus aberystwythensis TaxID=2316722 RepID=A0A3A8QC67_9BACT|nr:DUF1800 family protein [Corallococcus aberystwythensis]RKH66237.1 DUF1800 domain-containing protein [Corallococcus aberystwythensis]
MLRRTALALVLCATSCTQADGPSATESPPPEQQEVLGRAEQAADTLDTPSEPNSIRFLEQSSFGPKTSGGISPAPMGTAERVMAVGINQSLTDQFALPASAPYDGEIAQDLGSQFFQRAVLGQDQLRQRVAFALGQILVVSQNGIPESTKTAYPDAPVALAGYMNLLSQHAFGNFRTLMEEVTKNPAMGRYLDMVNNRAFDSKGDPIDPNENYAREMLQLFTLGTYKLNNDGTLLLDVEGHPQRAYTEENVKAFARALSGWTWNATACPAKGAAINTPDYKNPLMPCNVNHDTSSQELLRGVSTTAGGTITQHLTQALNNVFNDPNVPPFISRQLIQHLVTSNPSAAYVRRVANVFRNDGTGTRGNLEAVVRAILVDAEARGAQPPVALREGYGHLRSPVLFITNVVRWLNAELDITTKDPGLKLSNWSKTMNQWVPRSPSVFNYYPPNAPLPGADGLVGPEFAILDTATVTARANFLHEFLNSGSTANAGILVDYNQFPHVNTDLVAWMNRFYLHGTMSTDLEQRLLTAMNDSRADSVSRKKKLGLYLMFLSPSFQIQR